MTSLTLTPEPLADILPRPALYLPTETGEGATLLWLAPATADGLTCEEDYLAAVAQMGEARYPGLARLVWPLAVDDGVWQCQATGVEIGVDETETDLTCEALCQFVTDWADAATE